MKYFYGLLIFLLFSCSEENISTSGFTLLESKHTNLNFRNLVKETENFNIFKYQYFYNGGGTAIADFNNDGLDDVFFTGNMVKNRLFLNEGNLKFNDVTTQSKVAVHEGWCSGANAIDINNDGWMDIYVCRTAFPFEKLRKNLLLINQKDGTFEDEAQSYGLDDSAYSTQSGFFDFDRDGDLDMLLINHSIPEYSKGNLEIFKLKSKKDPAITNKLYENRNGKYVDISQQAGIEGNVLSFSLGLNISDFNNDGFDDIFISNDFNEPDYLFINQKNGTFLNEADQWFDNMSMFSMGTDAADINGDGYKDLMVLDMLPESNFLQKMHSGADNFEKVKSLRENGFLDQFSRNTLHLNSGNGKFREAGQMLGVSNTDWSWATLFFDFENNATTDLFISNGYLRDHTDMDFLQYTANEVLKVNSGGEAVTFEAYMQSMPPIIQPNYFYSNSNQKFQNKNNDWSLLKPSVSQGASYSDLDNDGDLDLIVNNSEDYSWLYRNNAEQTKNNWISFKLKGNKKNVNGIGANIKLHAGDKVFVKSLQPSRGFQSSVSYNVHFGLDNISTVDHIDVIWADGNKQKISSPSINAVNIVEYKKDETGVTKLAAGESIFKEVNFGIDYKHDESNFRDFNQQALMPFYLSDQSPKVFNLDIIGNGIEEIVICSDGKNSSKIYSQRNKGWTEINAIGFSNAEICDVSFSANKLYAASGSYKYGKESNEAAVGIYMYQNNSIKKTDSLPVKDCNPSCLAIGDLNNDGLDEVFVGGQHWKNEFPTASKSMLFGKGNEVLFAKNIGHISDAVIFDIDGDQTMELVVAGNWNGIRIFNLEDGQLVNTTDTYLSQNYKGHWLHLEAEDLNGDSFKELLVTNLGKNNQLSASKQYPMVMYYCDLDKNGAVEPLVGYFNEDEVYPLAAREDIISQIPVLKKKFTSFESYANQDLPSLVNEYDKNCPLLTIDTLAHLLFINKNGKLIESSLPFEMQIAPIYDCVFMDLDGDEDVDILCGGNKSSNKVKIARLSGNNIDGFLNDGKAGFEKAGIGYSVGERGDVRSLSLISYKNSNTLLYCPIDGQFKACALK